MGRLGWSMCGVIAGLVLGLPSLGAAATSGVCGRDVHAIRPAQLKTTCAMRKASGCEVAFSGVAPGSKPFGELHYQLMEFYGGDSGAVIFTSTPDGRLKPFACVSHVASTFGDRKESEPRIYSTSYGPLLDLPAESEGDGGDYGELLYVWRDGRWNPIDLNSWLDSLERRIKPNYEGWQGVGLNIPYMRSGTFLYAHHDSHISPSGYARMDFTIRNDKLVLTRLRIGPSRPVFEAMYNPKKPSKYKSRH